MKKLLASAVLAAGLVLLIGCAGRQSSVRAIPQGGHPSAVRIDYYGADLSQFPPKVREWIMKEAFPKHNMEHPAMVNSQLRVWWSDDNNAVYAESSHIIAEGYVGAGKRETWGQGSRYSGSPDIFVLYGEHAKYQTLRYQWELKQEVERLLKNDPAYTEIIAFAQQLCREIEYDWANFDGYRGPVRQTPNMRHAVCDGYSNEVMDKALKLRSVQAIEKWSSPGHAWNVLRLVDGRILYFDLTWFDNEYINHETGVIYQTDDYDWANITFNEDLFRHSGIGYGSRVFHHDIGRLEKTIKK